MGRGINKAVIVGILGKDPEVRYAENGSTVVNVSVVTNESWKDRETGESQQRTEWHRIVMFGRLGEIASQYLKKGSQAYFEGRIKTSKWQDTSGNDRYRTQIVASEMQMLDSRGGSGGGGSSFDQSFPGDSSQAPAQQQAPSGQAAPGGDDGWDDDIPF